MGEKNLQIEHIERILSYLSLIPGWSFPRACTDTIPMSSGPTGLSKISHLKEFFTDSLSLWIWMYPALLSPYLHIWLSLLRCFFFSHGVKRCLIGQCLSSPPFCELKLDTAVRFFVSCVVGEAFSGNICDHWCLNVKPRIMILPRAGGKPGDWPCTFHPAQENVPLDSTHMNRKSSDSAPMCSPLYL